MTKPDLEKILSMAPAPKAPAGLKEQLLADAPGKLSPGSTRPMRRRVVANWFRRWWPALAPAMASAACAVVLTVQQGELNDLKRALETPSATPSTHDNPSSGSSIIAANAGASQQAEVDRLKLLIAQLGSEVAQLQKLRAENENLRKRLSVPAITGLSQEEVEALENFREKALSIQCVNNLKQFGLAVRIWANDNNERQPPNIVTMSNELSTPKILVCPADRSRTIAADWAGFTDANSSYEYFVTPNFNMTNPTRVLSRCSIHGHIGLCDGSVHKELAKAHPDWLTERNGFMYLERATVITNTITR